MKELEIALISAALSATIAAIINLIGNHSIKSRDYKKEFFNKDVLIIEEYASIFERYLNIPLLPMTISDDEYARLEQELSRLFYKYYTYLPQQVLTSMCCLQKCISKRGMDVYFCKKPNTYMPQLITRYFKRPRRIMTISDEKMLPISSKDIKDRCKISEKRIEQLKDPKIKQSALSYEKLFLLKHKLENLDSRIKELDEQLKTSVDAQKNIQLTNKKEKIKKIYKNWIQKLSGINFQIQVRCVITTMNYNWKNQLDYGWLKKLSKTTLDEVMNFY